MTHRERKIIKSERVKKGNSEGQSNFAFFFLTKSDRQYIFMYRHRDRGRVQRNRDQVKNFRGVKKEKRENLAINAYDEGAVSKDHRAKRFAQLNWMEIAGC